MLVSFLLIVSYSTKYKLLLLPRATNPMASCPSGRRCSCEFWRPRGEMKEGASTRILVESQRRRRVAR